MSRARETVARRPMTEFERRMARALGLASFPPATFDKRFARALAARAELPSPAISEREAACLRRLVQRYRRQIPPRLLEELRATLAASSAPDPADAHAPRSIIEALSGVPITTVTTTMTGGV